jgi:integrase
MPAKAKNKVVANVEAIASLIRKIDKQEPDTQLEWKVEAVPGLSLIRTRDTAVSPGVWSWSLRFMAGIGARRKSVRKVIGRASGPAAKSLADAKAEALKVATNGAAGFGDDGETKQTLRELFEAFEKVNQSETTTKRRSERTMRDYRYYLERDVFKKLGHVPINEISDKDIAKVLMESKKGSPKAAHECRSALGSLYKWAKHHMLVDANPTIGMGFIHVSEPRDRLVTDDEVAALWRAIDSKEFGATKEMRRLLKIAILSGQRNSEVAGARRSELHIGPTVANPYWRIPRSRMKRKKGKQDQFVFLSTQAAALFQEALDLSEGSDYVFPAQPRGRHSSETIDQEYISQEGVSRAWARLREIAEVDGANLHDMRKSITTYLGDRGERADVLDRILDHAIGHHSNVRSSVTDSHYLFSTMAEPLKAAWQRWADHVDAVVAGKSKETSNVHQLVPASA